MLNTMLNTIKLNYVVENQDKFTENDGSIVYKNISFSYEDVQNLIIENKLNIINAICAESNRITNTQHVPTVHLTFLPNSSELNLQKALSLGVFGFPESKFIDKKLENRISDISEIKKGDILVFVKGWMSNNPKNASGRVSSDEYTGKYKEIIGVIVTEGFYEDYDKIWDDKVYPYRVNFHKDILFRSTNIPCSKDVLGESMHELIRKLHSISTVKQTDLESILKLLY